MARPVPKARFFDAGPRPHHRPSPRHDHRSRGLHGPREGMVRHRSHHPSRRQFQPEKVTGSQQSSNHVEADTTGKTGPSPGTPSRSADTHVGNTPEADLGEPPSRLSCSAASGVKGGRRPSRSDVPLTPGADVHIVIDRVGRLGHNHLVRATSRVWMSITETEPVLWVEARPRRPVGRRRLRVSRWAGRWGRGGEVVGTTGR